MTPKNKQKSATGTWTRTARSGTDKRHKIIFELVGNFSLTVLSNDRTGTASPSSVSLDPAVPFLECRCPLKKFIRMLAAELKVSQPLVLLIVRFQNPNNCENNALVCRSC